MHIYTIPQIIRDKCIIDIHEIESASVSSLDEYLLKFPKYRVLTYGYLKHSDKPVKLSTLYSLFGKDIGRWENDPARMRLLKKDAAYRHTITKYVNDDYSWSSSTSLFRAMFFDAKYLSIKEYRDEANRQVDRIAAKLPKHWSLPVVNLHDRDQISLHHNYHIERMSLIDEFWHSILKDRSVNLSSIEYDYFYDRFEIFIDDMTVRIILCSNGQIDVDVVKSSGLISGRNANVHLIRLTADYPVIGKILDQLVSNYDKITKFRQSMSKLEHNNATFNKLNVIVRQFVQELSDDSKYTYYDASTVQGVMINSRSITSYQFRHNHNTKRLTYVRTTNTTDASGAIVNVHDTHMRTTYDVKNLDDLARHLVRSGFINIYHKSYQIDYEDYVALLSGETDLYNYYAFRLTFSEIAYICNKYFDSCQTDIETSMNLGYQDLDEQSKYSFKPPKRQDLQTLFEVIYAENHAEQYATSCIKLQHQKLEAYSNIKNIVKSLNQL